jgi:RimJ/RimL family protein N-acetyltransferase
VLELTTAEATSVDAFLSVTAASPHQAHLRDYLDSLLRQECTKPGWCVLGLESGAPVSRAALWTLPGKNLPTDLVLIDGDWTAADRSPMGTVMAAAQSLARDLGAQSLGHSMDTPAAAPQYQEHERARIQVMEEFGYELLRDGVRWIYEGSPSESPPEHSLGFRPLPEVGEDAFVEAIAKTYEGTRDSWINQSIEEEGFLGAARADFTGSQGMEHRPDWWQLAYTDDGSLAGVIMTAKNPTSAVIAYVGVVSEKRGRGIAADLVRHGTDVLLGAGATEVRGDCDRDNPGMIGAFERAGFTRFARRRTYQRRLP